MSGGGPFDEADYYEVPESIDIYSWCPTPDGSGAPTQVHLHFGKAPGPIFVVRFKGPGGLDRIIAALTEHREHVWGPAGHRHNADCLDPVNPYAPPRCRKMSPVAPKDGEP